MNKNEITLLEMIINRLQNDVGNTAQLSHLLHNETYHDLLTAVPHIHMEMSSQERKDAIQAIQEMIDRNEEE